MGADQNLKIQVYFDGVLTVGASGYNPDDETSACTIYAVSSSFDPSPAYGHHNLTLVVDSTIQPVTGEITIGLIG